MSMFDAYKLVPEEYTPSNIHQTSELNVKPKKPLVAYNAFGEPQGFTWNRGDSICLEFNTTGNVVYEERDIKGNSYGVVEDAETYLTNPQKTLQLYIYDFRYNVIAFAEAPAHAKTVFYTQDIFKQSPVAGAYKLQLNLLDESTGISHTLIDGKECSIFIK